VAASLTNRVRRAGIAGLLNTLMGHLHLHWSGGKVPATDAAVTVRAYLSVWDELARFYIFWCSNYFNIMT
jgi:hypothetical protein